MLPTIGYTLARVAKLLRGVRGWEDTTTAYGPARAGQIVSFLKLYPAMFSIQGSGPNIKVLPAVPPPAPRPVQVGGASSSSSSSEPPPDRERQLRALEVDPCAPYRRFPNDQRVRYGANPARVGTQRYRRYERYKEAMTIGGSRRLGATSQDISMDVAAGALVLL